MSVSHHALNALLAQCACFSCAHGKCFLFLLPQIDRVTAEEKTDLDMLFIEMVIDAGLAFSFTENPAVQALFSKLRKAYKLPTRKDVSGLSKQVHVVGIAGITILTTVHHSCIAGVAGLILTTVHHFCIAVRRNTALPAVRQSAQEGDRGLQVLPLCHHHC